MTTQRLAEAAGSIERAATFIRAGGVVAFPTETVYGLGASAFQPHAVARVFELKARPRFDPLIVHIATLAEIDSVAASFPLNARKLAERFWPGPLTLVLPKRPIVPDIVTAGLPSVAIRQPDHPVARALIRAASVPIAAPSANQFGRTSPTTAAHVAEQFGEQLQLILDGGACRVGVESTIVSFLGPTPVLLRPGGVPLEDIDAVIGPVAVSASDGNRPLAPGQLPSHYAPRTPLRLLHERDSQYSAGRIGLLSFRRPLSTFGLTAVEILSEKGDLREAAANLFAAIRRLDAQRLDLILAEPVPETGLGRAIMDRLRRASVGTNQIVGPTEGT